MRAKCKTENQEEPHYCFELLYLKDLDLPFVNDYVYETAIEILEPLELAAFLMKTEWDCTFAEIADILEFKSRESARRLYDKALLKLRNKRSLMNKLRDFRIIYLNGGY